MIIVVVENRPPHVKNPGYAPEPNHRLDQIVFGLDGIRSSKLEIIDENILSFNN